MRLMQLIAEVVGMVLVLLSFFYQVGVLQYNQEMTSDARAWRLEANLDRVYCMTRTLLQEDFPKGKEHPRKIDDRYLNGYRYAPSSHAPSADDEFISPHKWRITVLFIVGSLLLIAGKIFEYKGERRRLTPV